MLMLTVTKLAKQFNISRTTILHYEKEGLLTPASRSDNGYRRYGSHEIARLELIVNYRSFGISIPEIKELLSKTRDNRQQQILRNQFNNLEQEVQKLRLQQLAIVNYLEAPELLKSNNMTKEKWTDIMRSSGLNDDDMRNWHRQFERLQPEAHREFLESLQIEESEIDRIRAWSRE